MAVCGPGRFRDFQKTQKSRVFGKSQSCDSLHETFGNITTKNHCELVSDGFGLSFEDFEPKRTGLSLGTKFGCLPWTM